MAKKKFTISYTAAGPCCSECGRGFYCWLGPDEGPCRHTLDQFDKKSLRECLKKLGPNEDIEEFLNNPPDPKAKVLSCPDCAAELYTDGTYLKFKKHVV